MWQTHVRIASAFGKPNSNGQKKGVRYNYKVRRPPWFQLVILRSQRAAPKTMLVCGTRVLPEGAVLYSWLQ